MPTGHEQFADDLVLMAMHALDPEDRARVEAHLEFCTECQRDYDRLQADLAMVALTAEPAEPSVDAKQRLLTAVAAEPKFAVQTARNPLRWWMWVPSLAAAAALLVAVGLWRENVALTGAVRSAQAALDTSRAELQRTQEISTLLNARDAVHVTLASAAAKPEPEAKLVYSPKAGRVLLMASNMKPVGPGKAYELWLIPMSGTPMPAGMFKPDEKGNGMVMMQPVPRGVQAKAFAITAENESGSTTPTMPIVIQGAASSP